MLIPGIKPYRTRGKNRGVALLFTYASFEHNIESYRNGVDADCKNLKYLFKELGFSVLAYMNLTLEASCLPQSASKATSLLSNFDLFIEITSSF